MTYDGTSELRVEATLHLAARNFEVEEAADAFLSDVEATPATGPEKWAAAKREGHTFVLAACAAGPCRLRYRVAARTAAKKLNDMDIISEEGDVIVAPPSTWLLTPPRESDQAKVRFRVTTPPGTSFVTGVWRSTEAPGAWDITLADLWTSPYSAFGPLRVRTVEPKSTPPARFDIAFAAGTMALKDDEIVKWASESARAVVGYFGGRFPMREWLLLIIPSRGHTVGEGKTLSGGGGTVFLRVGEHATPKETATDWVLVHEMTHLTLPTLPRPNHWAEEGVATYVEPFARARIGTLSVDEAWKGVIEGVPNGLPEKGDEGLDRTPTWGRTYWGGALFCLLADVEIRKRTGNKLGLEHALRGINTAGGNNAVRWPLEDALAEGDKAVGVPVLTELHKKMGSAPYPVDLPALWKELGVRVSDGKVTYDDAAPGAAIRKAITTAN